MAGWVVFTTKPDNLSSTPGTSHYEKGESAPDSYPDFHICATLNKHITNNYFKVVYPSTSRFQCLLTLPCSRSALLPTGQQWPQPPTVCEQTLSLLAKVAVLHKFFTSFSHVPTLMELWLSRILWKLWLVQPTPVLRWPLSRFEINSLLLSPLFSLLLF